MKRVTEQYGKTVEEAVRKGLEELKVARDEVKIEVIDTPSTGLLGILSSKMAKVRLIVDKKVDESELKETAEKVKEIVSKIFEITNDESKFDVVIDNNRIVLKIDSGESKHLIGTRGVTLEAIQSTINSILQHENENCAKVFVEVNNYKDVKETKLKEFAKKLEADAVKYRKDIHLEPMTSYERMLIHSALANSDAVTTESIGEEPNRCLVVRLKDRSIVKPGMFNTSFGAKPVNRKKKFSSHRHTNASKIEFTKNKFAK